MGLLIKVAPILESRNKFGANRLPGNLMSRAVCFKKWMFLPFA